MNATQLASQLRALEKRAAKLVPNRLTDEQIISAIRKDDWDSQVLNHLFDIIETNFKQTVQLYAFLRRLDRTECGAGRKPWNSLDVLCEALSWFPGEQCDQEVLACVNRMKSWSHEPFGPVKGVPLAFPARAYLCGRLLASWNFDELQEDVIEWWAKPETVLIAGTPVEQAKRLHALTEDLHISFDPPLVRWQREDATLVDIVGQYRTARDSTPRRTRGRVTLNRIGFVPDPDQSVPG